MAINPALLSKMPAPGSDPMLEDDLAADTVAAGPVDPEMEAMLADLDDDLLVAEMEKRGFQVAKAEVESDMGEMDAEVEDDEDLF